MKKGIKIAIIIVSILVLINIITIFPFGKNIINNTNSVITGAINNTKNFVGDSISIFKNNAELNLANKLLTSDLENLKVSKEKLENDINLLNQENESLRQQVSSISRLSTSLNNFGNSNFNLLSGEIISRNLYNWNDLVTINIGSANGKVLVGSPVIYNANLFGFVKEVLDNSSVVQLVTDSNTNLNIPVLSINNGEKNGIIESYDNTKNMFVLKMINNLDVLKEGDVIYTNGYQENVAKGIEVGVVGEVVQKDDTLTNVYYVKPVQNITNAKKVEVLVYE